MALKMLSKYKKDSSRQGTIIKLDLSKIPNGKYQGSSKGYRGHFKVEVQNGIIIKIKVLQTREDRPLNSLSNVSQGIVEKQGLAGVDAITSATVTSEAIMNAVVNALVK